MARNFKIVVERHSDGFVAYPLGMKGVVVGEGDSYEQALSDVEAAIRFHIETFGDEVLTDGSPVIEAFIAETTLSA
jgi:predicted RNase H-like HicB family nuclease